jgi:ABC-2 type transport system permease protein
MGLPLIEFAFMLVVDLLFLVALFILMLPLGIWRQAAFAVMKRNFIGYFSNPTGYVFLCLFVLLTSFAAFWPHEFFTSNLANFDQLNKFLPYIMLIFIPAITMSIWAEEKRQGTDELLLTLPAKDFDIVIGKYFAAVLVFTVSLLFSQLSNFAVLLSMTDGNLDNLLLFSTYLGYWFVGIAMIALGSVASFLTSNLTVGFIFGAVFNAPLAFFSNADVIFSSQKWIQRLFDWSLLERFEPFGRGLITASSICYFLGIVVVGIYLSMILIGRRHWLGGRDGTSMLWHFVLRACFLFVMVVSAVLIVQYSTLNRARIDISDEKVSTLSPSTLKLLDKLSDENEEGSAAPINVTAYVGNDIPSEFVRTKYDLVNLLREFDALGGSRINVDLKQGVEPFSKQAVLASKRYGIRPQKFTTQSRGVKREAEVVLGLAVASGVERVVVPFLPYGTPVEYELMRSINTVSQDQRKTIGIVLTDAVIQGAVVPTPDGKAVQLPVLKIVRELAKQYDVETVNATSEIDLWVSGEEDRPDQRRYSMLLVAQPSKMSQAEMSNLILAIESGQPTAIFEDPFPNPFSFKQRVPGTFGPRALNRGGQPADIQKLWKALDIDTDRVSAGNGQYIPWIVWQPESFNPYPKDKRLSLPELVIVKQTDPTNPTINRSHPATSKIDELFFQYAGYVSPTKTTELEFTPLVKAIGAGRLRGDLAMPQVPEAARNSQRGLADGQFVLACHIKGSQWEEQDPSAAPSKDRVNVIYVADIDVLSDYFVDIRNEPIRDGIEYFFQDMSFALNIVDALAGEDTFLGLRNRRFRHVTLGKIEAQKEKELQKVFDLNNQYEIDFKIEVEKVRADARKKLRPLEGEIKNLEDRRDEKKSYDAAALAAKQGILKQQQQEQEQKLRVSVQELNNSLNERKRQADLDAELAIQEIQRTYKLAAVVLPVIPPFLLGIFVFTRRRLREREGISKERRLT